MPGWEDGTHGVDRSGYLPGREVSGNDDEVSKGTSAKQRAVVSADADRLVVQEATDPTKLIDGRLPGGSNQGVGQRDQQPPGALAVDVSIGPTEIAQGLLD